MTLTIRDAHVTDWRFIEELGKRTLMDSVSALRRPSRAAVEENFATLLRVVRGRPHRALVAEEQGHPLGFMLMLDSLPDEVTGEDQGFVAYMAVEPEAQGRGIGSALLARAEDEARRLGLPYMALMVTEENASARALYERAGYVVERRLLCKTL